MYQNYWKPQIDVEGLSWYDIFPLSKIPKISGEASPKIWSCYANISVFIVRENNQFLKK
jgi:hypothetical protein